MERSTIMPTGPAAAVSPADLQKKADSYVKTVEAAFQNPEVTNYWRCGNAASTLLDYFHLGGKITKPDFIPQKHQWFVKEFPKWFDETGNLWFDDYLWWTIAALKNASNGLSAPWDQIFKITWKNARPALTVWETAVKKYGKYQEYQPRVPHGVWNARWTEHGPWEEVVEKDGRKIVQRNVLLGIQNAVVNLLYLNAAARAAYFDSNFTQFALDEYNFLDNWFQVPPVNDRLLLRFASSGPAHEPCVLVHERVSTFHDVKVRDPYYNPGFFWTGDQGLLLGAAMRLMGMLQIPPPIKIAAHDLALSVIRGVKDKLVKDGAVKSWTCDQPAPQGDAEDYISGRGVFLRYVLDAWGWPELKAELHRTGFDALILSMAAKVPDPPRRDGISENDCPTPPPTDENDCLNPWTNELATLLAAMAILKSPA
jgi:hypothetical protein